MAGQIKIIKNGIPTLKMKFDEDAGINLNTPVFSQRFGPGLSFQ